MYELIDYLNFRWWYILISVVAILLLLVLLSLMSIDRRVIIFPLVLGVLALIIDYIDILPLFKMSSEDPDVSDEGLYEAYQKYDIPFIKEKMSDRLNSRIRFGLAVVYVIKAEADDLPVIELSSPRYFNDHRILNEISSNLDYPVTLEGLNDFVESYEKKSLIKKINSKSQRK